MKDKTAIFGLNARFLEPKEFEAFATEDDPYRSWIHFIFTDDKPNRNKQRIPREEFENLVRSAQYMPIKKAVGGIGDTHENAVPMGSIAKAKIEEDEQVGRIEGLAALWRKEFPDDILHLRQAFDDGKPINFSWEIGYQDAAQDEDNPEIEILTGCTTRAATIVSLPAYGDRTRALAMASEDSIKRYEEFFTEFIVNEEYNITGMRDLTQAIAAEADIEAQKDRVVKYDIQIRPDGNITKPTCYASLVDSQFADPVNYAYPIDKAYIEDTLRYWGRRINRIKYNKTDQEVISRRIAAAAERYEVKFTQEESGGLVMDVKELRKLFEGLEPTDQATAALDALTEMFEEFKGIEDELTDLRDWKTQREEDDVRANVLNTRLAALKEIGIEYTDEQLEARAKSLIEMSDDSFQLFVDQLVAISAASDDGEDKDSKASLRVPKITGTADAKANIDIVKGFYTKKEDKE